MSVSPGIRPLSALPQNFELSNWEGKTYRSTRAYRAEDETFAGRRRMQIDVIGSTGAITYHPDRQTAVIRIEGQAKCITERWWDPCGGVAGGFGVVYAPPPSPPPPSPPLPPPPPPTPPPDPVPPAAPRSFAADLQVSIPTASVGTLKASEVMTAVQERTLAGLTGAERNASTLNTEVIVDTTLTLTLTGDVNDPAFQEQIRRAAEAQAGRQCRLLFFGAPS